MKNRSVPHRIAARIHFPAAIACLLLFAAPSRAGEDGDTSPVDAARASAQELVEATVKADT